MRKAALLSLLLLTGCAAHHAQSQITQMAKVEFSAWETVAKLNQEQCPNSTKTKPLPRSKALEKYECWAELVHENVSPVAMAPDLLMKLLTDAKQSSLDYKKGRIDRDEVNLEHEKLFAQYYAALDARARNLVMNAQLQDQAFAQRLGNASRESQRQEAATAQPNTIKNTNCQVWNKQVNCTSW